MLTSLLLLAFAASGLTQPPEGYRTVYITSAVDTTFRIVPTSPKNGSTIVVQKAKNAVEQQWYIKANSTKIQLANTTLCLDAGPKTNWKDMAPIYVKECLATEVAQNWTALADGRIALAASSNPQECIDLQYMRATPNNPVGLYTCQGLNNIGAADKGINWPLTNVTTP
ncbi:hypothetical protein B0O99DRAFT_602395 [Bisporella sp. PMI_857]|nr:hypothetical protein B0O99DRAFT_602395 [Bisporella sp. PMI_857]